jgi:hypothetical protein
MTEERILYVGDVRVKVERVGGTPYIVIQYPVTNQDNMFSFLRISHKEHIPLDAFLNGIGMVEDKEGKWSLEL